jgi:DNA-binding CsgD family transcriptional regulator
MDVLDGTTTPGTDLLERRGEVAAIADVLGAAERGSGRCLLLWGGPGLGKSRLVAAACEAGRERSMTVLRARGGELERDYTFGVAVQLFEPLLARAADERETLLSGAAALSEPLFAHGGAAPTGSAGEFPFLHGLHWLAANAAERAPLVLAVDDAHWSDALSLRWLVYLLQRLDELPIAMVVTARPEEPGPQAEVVKRIARHGLTTERSLAPLSADAVGELIRAELGDADDELVGACVAATGGNPFYVRDFVAALRAGGDGADAARVPAEPVSGAVLSRISALADPAPALAAAVAVLGSGAPLERAATLADVGVDDAASAADSLAEVAVLERGTQLAFAHPLVREAVYSNLPEARRARAHARAAELLREADANPEHVASHLVEAGGAAGDWAAPALRIAAARASGRGAPAAAVRYLRAAAGCIVSESERGVLLTELAVAEAKTRERGAVGRGEDALAAIAEPRERAAAALEIGMALVDASEPKAEAIFARGLEALDGEADEKDELAMTLRASRLAVGIGHATAQTGDLETIVGRGERGVATPGERLVLAHGALGPALRGERIEEVRRLARASLAGEAPDVTSPTAIAARSFAATALFMAGELDEATAALSSVIERARARGAVLAFGTLSHLRAHALQRRGRLDDAIADAQSALDTVRYGWEPELPAVYAVLALCLIERGEVDAAEAALEVPGGEERWGTTFTWADVLDARGRLSLARGDAQGALDDFMECGERLKAIGTSHCGVVPWRPGAADAALALGDTELAGEVAAEEVELSRAFGARRELGMALRTAGVVAGGDRGLALLREAVGVLRESEADLELAHALCDLGGALLAEDHRLVAREALAEALDLAHRCRADALEEVARERLVATGARPRRASARGSDALTPRERRIVTMAAEGLANREIAEALFITTKTVETHLGRAYRKLGIGSRRELAGALAD